MSPEVSVVPKMDIHQTFLKKKCTVEIQCIGNITKLDYFCVQSLMFRPAGLYSTDTSTWTPDAQILSAKQSKNVNFTELVDYNDEYGDNDEDSPLWMVLMDQSQLVMTIVGFIANMATSITLIKNGQVCGPYFLVALCVHSVWKANIADLQKTSSWGVCPGFSRQRGSPAWILWHRASRIPCIQSFCNTGLSLGDHSNWTYLSFTTTQHSSQNCSSYAVQIWPNIWSLVDLYLMIAYKPTWGLRKGS